MVPDRDLRLNEKMSAHFERSAGFQTGLVAMKAKRARQKSSVGSRLGTRRSAQWERLANSALRCPFNSRLDGVKGCAGGNEEGLS
ncbi:MAG: hypothetical protein JWM68_968 [Verrucomicrobiales bacterium]|nr:hypothetical protein [Verrucomicrobiales bacterium]